MRVLVPLGVQGAAEEICAVTAYLCERGRDRVDLLSIISPSEIRETRSGAPEVHSTPQGTPGGHFVRVERPSLVEAESRSQAVERVRGERLAFLDGLGERFFTHVPFEAHVEVASDVADAILDAARRLEVSGIAMGIDTRGGVRALFGSTAETVLRESPVPVLIVRKGMLAAAPPA